MLTPLSKSQMLDILHYYQDLEERHYEMELLWGLHTKLRGLLPEDFCVNLNFHGPPECGKTRSARLMTEVVRGEFIEYTTEAFILGKSAELNSKSLVMGIDQVDDLITKVPAVSAILETSNRWDAKYGYSAKETKGKWKPTSIPCGGPKVFTTIASFGHALSSREYEIPVYESPIADQLFHRFSFRGADIEKLAVTLDDLATDIRAKFTPEDIFGHVSDQTVIDSFAPLRKYGARKFGIATVFETVGWLAGWGIDVLPALSYDVSDDDAVVFRAILLDIIRVNPSWHNGGAEVSVFGESFNGRWFSAYGKKLSPNELGRRMTALGFTEKNGLRERRRDGWFYRFPHSVQTTLKNMKDDVRWGTLHLR